MKRTIAFVCVIFNIVSFCLASDSLCVQLKDTFNVKQVGMVLYPNEWLVYNATKQSVLLPTNNDAVHIQYDSIKNFLKKDKGKNVLLSPITSHLPIQAHDIEIELMYDTVRNVFDITAKVFDEYFRDCKIIFYDGKEYSLQSRTDSCVVRKLKADVLIRGGNDYLRFVCNDRISTVVSLRDYEKHYKTYNSEEYSDGGHKSFFPLSVSGIIIVVALCLLSILLLIWLILYFRRNSTKHIDKDEYAEKHNAKPENQGDDVSAQKELKKHISDLTQKCSNLEKEKSNLQNKLNDATDKQKRAEERLSTIKSEIEEKANIKLSEAKKEADQRYKDLRTQKESVDEDLRKLKINYKDCTNELENTKNQLNSARHTINSLEESQKVFTDKISFVPFAETYAKNIKKIVDIQNGIIAAIPDLVEKVEDPYYIYRTIYKFNIAMSEVEESAMLTDVEMVSMCQMIFKIRTIGTVDPTVSDEDKIKFVKQYFYGNYLEKYIGAITICLEHLIAMPFFYSNELSDGDVKVVEQLRVNLNQIADDLGITIETVHLLDDIGQKTDLQAEIVDMHQQSGKIVDIENCWVYLTGGNRPTSKIHVKVQG